jgi:nucleotide-binding universal stress UspA family protein
LRDIEEELAGLRDAGHSLTDYCNSIRIDSIEEEPVKGILSYADEMDATLIVLGSFAAADAVAEAVLRHASRPVMVLKEPEEQETDLEMQA